MPSIKEGGFLKSKKTYVVAAMAVLAAVAAYLTGDATLIEAFQLVIDTLGGES